MNIKKLTKNIVFTTFVVLALWGATFLISPLLSYAQEQSPEIVEKADQSDTADDLEGEAKLNIYLFHGDGCPHCAKALSYLEKVKGLYGSEINIYLFEIYYNLDNAELFNDVLEELGIDVAGVPFLVVGQENIIGYESDSTTGKKIRTEVEGCISSECVDIVEGMVFNGKFDQENIQVMSEDGISSEPEQDETVDSDTDINIPFVGSIELKNLSLPVATFLIAFMDGFNPCAMWILIFLITMLINMEDKKRLYTLGSIFIITSGVVYFVFLAAWFNFFKFIGYVYWIKVVIGIVAIASGVLHIKNAITSKGECHVVDAEKRRSIMQKIKDITKEKSFGLAVVGIITLAVSVNLIEVVCSAGLPSIYTNLLAAAELNMLQYYMYLLFYTVVFMLDDLVIFFIAVKTFEVTGITSKYTKWSSIIGGVLIFIIGILLIFKPEALMFG